MLHKIIVVVLIVKICFVMLVEVMFLLSDPLLIFECNKNPVFFILLLYGFSFFFSVSIFSASSAGHFLDNP